MTSASHPDPSTNSNIVNTSPVTSVNTIINNNSQQQLQQQSQSPVMVNNNNNKTRSDHKTLSTINGVLHNNNNTSHLHPLGW